MGEDCDARLSINRDNTLHAICVATSMECPGPRLCECAWEGGHPQYCHRNDALEQEDWPQEVAGKKLEKSTKRQLEPGPARELTGGSGGVKRIERRLCIGRRIAKQLVERGASVGEVDLGDLDVTVEV